MSKSILIIGGTGVLSAAVVDCCVVQGHDVTMINRGNNEAYINPAAKVILCDARNSQLVKQKIAHLHFDVVLDFIVFTKEQLEQSLAIFGYITDQYIFISSAQVYNTSVQKIFEENDETPQPLWSYSSDKDICEKYLRAYCREHQINYTIIRPGVNYDNRRIPYGMYPPMGMHYTIIARILAGKPIITWNNGLNKLNLTRVEDFAAGLVGLLGNPKAYNETFNVVGDFVYTWQQVLDVLEKILNVPVLTVDIPLNLYANELKVSDREMLLGGRACDLVCSNKKLKSIVHDFNPSIELEQGIRMTLDWYKENNYYRGFDYKWDAEQDRIIKELAGIDVGYKSYSSNRDIHRLYDFCVYKSHYYRNNSVKGLFYKIVHKIIKSIV